MRAVKPGRGTGSPQQEEAFLPPALLLLPASLLSPAGVGMAGGGSGWRGAPPGRSAAPRTLGTHTAHTHVAAVPPFPSTITSPGPGGSHAAIPPLCFTLQLASSLRSSQSWNPSQTKPRWMQSPWSQKCSSHAQLSAVRVQVSWLVTHTHIHTHVHTHTHTIPIPTSIPIPIPLPIPKGILGPPHMVYSLSLGATARYRALNPGAPTLPSETKVTRRRLEMLLKVGGTTLPQNLGAQ